MEALINILISEIQKLRADQHGSASPWMDINEASKYLKISGSTLRKLTAAGKIPFKHVGDGAKSKILLSKKKLNLWIITGKISDHTKRDREQLEVWV